MHHLLSLTLLFLFLCGHASAVTVNDVRPGAGEAQASPKPLAPKPEKPSREIPKNEKEAAREELSRLHITQTPEESKFATYMVFVAGPLVLLLAVLAFFKMA